MSLINRLIDANDYNAEEHWLHGDEGFFMCTLTPENTGLDLYLSMDDTGGMGRTNNAPRVWIHSGYNTTYQCEAIVTIELKPKVLVEKCIKRGDRKKIKSVMDYVGRNHDLFLKHYFYNKTKFYNSDLFDTLEANGELK